MSDLTLLGRLAPQIAAPSLIEAGSHLSHFQERLVFAQSSRAVPEPRLVPMLAALLDPSEPQTRWFAEEALMRIDTDEAASVLWPHLNEQTALARKLELVSFLGRHGFRNTRSMAIEHLSQVQLRDAAVEALVNVADASMVAELRKHWQVSNDTQWSAAAIQALARLGQADIAPRLLEIASTPGDPLAPSALLGLGDLGLPEAVPVIRQALGSRSETVVIAACRASARILAKPGINDPAIRTRLTELLVDADAATEVREAALSALTRLGDPSLAETLVKVARDANLEGTPLLNRVESILLKKPLNHSNLGQMLLKEYF